MIIMSGWWCCRLWVLGRWIFEKIKAWVLLLYFDNNFSRESCFGGGWDFWLFRSGNVWRQLLFLSRDRVDFFWWYWDDSWLVSLCLWWFLRRFWVLFRVSLRNLLNLTLQQNKWILRIWWVWKDLVLHWVRMIYFRCWFWVWVRWQDLVWDRLWVHFLIRIWWRCLRVVYHRFIVGVIFIRYFLRGMKPIWGWHLDHIRDLIWRSFLFLVSGYRCFGYDIWQILNVFCRFWRVWIWGCWVMVCWRWRWWQVVW